MATCQDQDGLMDHLGKGIPSMTWKVFVVANAIMLNANENICYLIYNCVVEKNHRVKVNEDYLAKVDGILKMKSHHVDPGHICFSHEQNHLELLHNSYNH